jgi:hypothetical protein
MEGFRFAIISGKLEEFITGFLINYYNNVENIPLWVKNALDKYNLINY